MFATERDGRFSACLLLSILVVGLVLGPPSAVEARIEPQLPPFEPTQAIFHPSEPFRLLLLEGNGIVSLWDVRDPGDPERLLSIHGSATAAAFTPDGERILTAQQDGKLRIWNLRGKLENEVTVSTFGITQMSAAAGYVATESSDGQVQIWDLEGRLQARFETDDEKLLATLELSSTGELLAMAHVDSTIRLWSRDGNLEETFESSPGTISALAFGPRDEWLAVASKGSSSVHRWSLDGTSTHRPFLEHEDSVFAIARRGDLIASAGLDKTIRLWDLDGSPRGEPLRGHSEEIGSVTLSADGRRIASIDDEGNLRFWEIGWSRRGEPFGGHGTGLGSVRLFPETRLAAAGNADGSVQLWRIDEEEPQEWEELWISQVAQPVGPVAFSPDGERLIFGDSKGRIHFRDLDGNEPRPAIVAHPETYIHSLEFLPDGTGFASAADNGTFRLWNREGEPRTQPIQAHGRRWIGQLAISPRGDLLATGGGDGAVRLWELDGTPRGEPLYHEEAVWAVAFSSDGELIAAAGDRNGVILLWNADGTPFGRPLRGHEGPICCLAFHEEQLASGGRDGTTRLWSLAGDGRSSVLTMQPEFVGSTLSLTDPAFIFEVSAGPVYTLAWMPDGEHLVTSTLDSRLWMRALDGRYAHLLSRRENRVTALAITPDDRIFATSGSDSQIDFWRRGESVAFAAAADHVGLVHALAFSPGGEFLVSAGEDHTVRLWSAEGWSLAEPFRGHEAEVLTVAFSPDGTLIASGDAAGSIRFWTLAGKPWGRVLEGPERGVPTLAFSPDGSLLATATSGGSSVWLWDLESMSRLRVLEAPMAPIDSLAFRPDGHSLVAAGGQAGESYTWSLEPDSRSTPEPWISNQPEIRARRKETETEASEKPTIFKYSGIHAALSPSADTIMTAGRVGMGFRDRSGHHELLTDDFTDLATFSPSGHFLLSGHSGRLQLWSHDGRLLNSGFSASERVIQQLLFFPDHRRFLTLETAGDVRLWSLDGSVHGRSVAAEPIRSLALSRDGQKIAFGSRSGNIHLLDSSLEPLAPPFFAHANGIFALDFSSDGQLLVSSGYHDAIVWDVQTPSAREVSRAPVGTGSVHFLPDLPRVSFVVDQTLHIWNFPDEPESIEMGIPVTATVPARSHELAAAGDANGLVVLAEMQGETARILGQHRARIESMVFSADESHLASLDQDAIVRLWKTDAPESEPPLPPIAVAATQIGFLGDTLWALTPPGIVSLYDPSAELLGRVFLTSDGILLAAENGLYGGKGAIVRNFSMYTDTGRKISESGIAERFDDLRAEASIKGELSGWQEARARLRDTIQLVLTAYGKLPVWLQIVSVPGMAYLLMFVTIAGIWWSRPERLAAWAMPDTTRQELESWKHLAQALALIRLFGTSRRALDAWLRANDRELYESCFAGRSAVQRLSAFADLGQGEEIARWLDSGARGQHTAVWISGPGGCGKSTLACHMARQGWEAESGHPVIPVLVDRWTADSLFEQARPFLKAGGNCPSVETVEKLANSGRLILVVDGLSEMGRPPEEAPRLANRFRESPFPLIISTRTATYPPDTFQAIDLAPIPDQRLPALAAAYVPEEDVAEAVAALRRLTRGQAIKPLFVRLALEVFQESGDLPATFPALIWNYAKGSNKGKLSENELFRAATIAAKVCCDEALAPRAESGERILAFLQAELELFGIEQEIPPAQVLDELERCGLLEYISEDLIHLRFANDVIAEYFMARYIVEQGESPLAMKLRRRLQQAGDAAQGLREALEQMDRALHEQRDT